MEKLNELVELAKKATSGEWNAFISAGGDGTFSIHTPDDSRKGNVVNWPGFDTANCSKAQKKANAKYIAAAHPDTILAIAEAFRALEQRAEAAEAKLDEQAAEVDKANSLIDDLREERNFLQRLAGERGNKLEIAEGKLATAERAMGAKLAETEALSESRFDRVVELQAKVDYLFDKLAELEKQEHPQAVVRHYTGCKYPIIKVNSLEVVIAGDREDAEELADFINSIRPAPAINLAELVPDELSWTNSGGRTMDEVNSWNACRAAILRNIEEAK